MPDHKYPLQMEALALAVQSTPLTEHYNAEGQSATSDEITQMILRRASAFLGWAQASTPSKDRPPGPRPLAPLGDAIEGPVR